MSGLSRTPGKRVWDNIPTRVRIPPSPPIKQPPLRWLFYWLRWLVLREPAGSTSEHCSLDAQSAVRAADVWTGPNGPDTIPPRSFSRSPHLRPFACRRPNPTAQQANSRRTRTQRTDTVFAIPVLRDAAMALRRFYRLARKSVEAWFDDYAASMGAAIAYYTVFSIAPLLIIVIAVAGAVFGREAVEGEIVGQIAGLIGTETAMGVQGLIRSASQPTSGVLATVISLGLLLIGSTSVFAELQAALDRIWRVPVAARRAGLWLTLACPPALLRPDSGPGLSDDGLAGDQRAWWRPLPSGPRT